MREARARSASCDTASTDGKGDRCALEDPVARRKSPSGGAGLITHQGAVLPTQPPSACPGTSTEPLSRAATREALRLPRLVIRAKVGAIAVKAMLTGVVTGVPSGL